MEKLMIAVDELTDYLDEYLEEKQEVKNLTTETIRKQTFNISKFIEYLEHEGIDELTDKNVKKQLRHYRRYCLKKRGNKRTTVKTYMMNILEFINSEDVQEEIQHETIKMKDIIEVLNQKLKERFGDTIKVQIKVKGAQYVYKTKFGLSQAFDNPNAAYEAAKDYLDNIELYV